ncbi:MAG: glycosyltransferase [Ilumatobacter sp.]|nr:glycosyltransferase [Ilumatobacter sp.]
MTVSAPTRPTVSVVMATKNRSELARRTLQSLFELDPHDFELEVVVVDDGSTDDTVEQVTRLPVRLIRTEGVGMAEARSLGLRAASGDFVTVLDDDDVVLPAAFHSQLAVFREHPEVALVHAQAQLVGPDLTPFGDPFPYSPLPKFPQLRDCLSYFPQVGTIVTRMEAAREAGDFDPTLPGDNDWDWMLRIVRRHPVAAVEEPVLLFRQRDEPQEELAWRRYPAVATIFRRHTGDLPVVDRVRLRPVMWRHRGWCTSMFLNHAHDNWCAGDRHRALTSLGYAVRTSPVHVVVEGGRRIGRSLVQRVRGHG